MGDPTNIRLVDVNGETWHLAGDQIGAEGAALEAVDLVDVFEEAPVKTIRDEGAFQVGSQYRGMRIMTRYPTFNVLLLETLDSPLRDNLRRWKRGWSFSEDCKLYVEDEDSTRYMELRKHEQPKLTDTDSDPNQAEAVSLEMRCVAGNPFYREDDVLDEFITTTDTTGGGTETGYVDFGGNPCDVEIWLQWVVQGEAGIRWTIPDYSWGSDEFDRAVADANRAVQLPPLLAGEHLKIDTDKMSQDGQVNSSLDTQVYMRMGGKRLLYRVPPHTELPPGGIPVQVTGAPIGAGIQVRAPRNWWAATGGFA